MSPVTFRTARDLPPMSRSADTMLWNRTGSWRFLRPRYQDKLAPCSEGCPAAEDIARVQMLLGQGDFEGAWLRIREENPLPGVCGRVCYHPCESVCNRGEYDDPVSVNSLERFLADHAWKLGLAPPPLDLPAAGRVAVVGAGPAGLAASYFLRRLGHDVDLFDAREEPGGLLRYGIPEYRLPLDALAWEVGLILDDGVRFHGGRRLGADLAWDDLQGYDAVFLAVGAWAPAPLGAQGEEHAIEGLELLESIRRGERPEIRGKVAVIGGGNTAMDVARSLLRLGAEPVVYYRRRLQDMPALPDEIEEAREEGIPLQTLLAPKRIEPLEGGGYRLVLATMMILEEDEPAGRPRVVPSGHPDVEVEVAAVVTAIGARPSEGVPSEVADGEGLVVEGLHLRRIAPRGPWADRPPVYVGGDLVNDRKAVVTAIASGKEAALVIDARLRGRDPAEIWPEIRIGRKGGVSMNRYRGGDRAAQQDHVVRYEELNTIYFEYRERRDRPRITLEERRTGFDEVKMRISASMALRESERCFHCGQCDQCDNCYLFCPDVSVLRDLRAGSREINYEYCKGCGVCVVECPRNAMVLEEEPR